MKMFSFVTVFGYNNGQHHYIITGLLPAFWVIRGDDEHDHHCTYSDK